MIETVLTEHNAVGIENALTITELCILTGKTIREITKAVEDERKSGVLICSRMEGKGGYCICNFRCDDEGQLACRCLRNGQDRAYYQWHLSD